MPNPPPPPPKPRVTRSLPYFQIVNLGLSIADSLVTFYHHVMDQRGQLQKVSGDHQLTSQEIATLNAGGTVVFTDKNGNSHHLKL